MGTSREDVRAFPQDARKRAGYELYQVQRGLEPSDWKPMTSVGTGVKEIRVRTELEHRLVYIAKFEEGVYVLHAFEKKARRAPRRDIEIARARLKSVLDERRPRAPRRE